MRGLLRDYQKETGASILLASHNMVEVERLCSHVLLMQTGRIVERGSPQSLIDKYGRDTMEEVFLDIARNRGRFAKPEAAQ
jgi:ABC-2 type transport system ATP-binding protein